MISSCLAFASRHVGSCFVAVVAGQLAGWAADDKVLPASLPLCPLMMRYASHDAG